MSLPAGSDGWLGTGSARPQMQRRLHCHLPRNLLDRLGVPDWGRSKLVESHPSLLLQGNAAKTG